jgi:hypothetical protein
MENIIKETLEKQLQLLSERSQTEENNERLAALTVAMIDVVNEIKKDY